MPNPTRFILVAAAVASLLAAGLFIKGSARAELAVELSAAELRDPERIARGQYLAVAGNCSACHSVDGAAPLAGGVAFQTPFGTIYSTNITPDRAAGIGAWTQVDFLNAMRHGQRPNGEHLYPAFPYSAYTRLSDDDIADLYAYLQSVPAASATAPENALPFPLNQRSLLAFWKALYFKPGSYAADATQPAAWNRGAYLVEALAHCSACHTPRNALGAQQYSRAMSGGEYFDRVGGEGYYRPWSAPDLTGSARGLGLWSEEDLVAYLGSARNDFLESFGPMNEVIMHSTRHLLAEDLEAMAQYLKSLPAAEIAEAAMPDALTLGRGRTVYNLHCGTCHLPTGEGDPEMAPRLNGGSLVVQSENPASLINAILYAPEPPTPALPEKWRKPMEEFQYLLDDEEVAAVASFIRSSWGNRAGAVSAAQVARQR